MLGCRLGKGGWLSIRAMDNPKIWLLWALGVAGVGLVLGIFVSGGLWLALGSQLPLPSWWWVLARYLVVASDMCVVASGVLLAMGMNGQFREWVVGRVLRR